MRSTIKAAALRVAAGRPPARAGVPVLLYHSIDDSGSALSVPPRQFRVHMETLRREGWTVLGLAALLERWSGEGEPPRRTVAITLDDALDSQHREAFPVLRDLGLGATVFAPTDVVGGEAGWNRPDFPVFPLMGWDGIEEMLAAGIEVQPHGRRHRSLPTLDGAALADEVAGSVAELERRTGVSTRVFCYPYGHENEVVREAVRAAGVLAAAAVRDGIWEPGDDLLRIPRVCMDNVRAPDDRAAGDLVRAALNGTLPALTRAKRRVRAWLPR